MYVVWPGKPTTSSNTPPQALKVFCADGLALEFGSSYKYLAFWLDSSLSFSMHIDNLQSKVKTRLCFLYWNEAFFMYSVKYILVKNYYCHPDWLRWCNLSNYIKEHLSKLDTLHHLAVCFATGAPFATHHCNLYTMMGCYSLSIGWLQHWLWLLDKTVFGKTPC